MNVLNDCLSSSALEVEHNFELIKAKMLISKVSNLSQLLQVLGVNSVEELATMIVDLYSSSIYKDRVIKKMSTYLITIEEA